MKKGFTLIELLAVIVILAIIALIATPIVISIIDDSKSNSLLRSANFYLDTVENTIMTKNMNSGGNFNPSTCTVLDNGNLSCDDNAEPIKVEVNGEVPDSGTIEFLNGNINTAVIGYGSKSIMKTKDGQMKYAKGILVDYIKKIYKETNTVTNNGVTYNIDENNSLINDRLGGISEDLNGGNIRYYGISPNNYIDIGDKDSSGNTILWRIIGVFNDVKLEDGTSVDLVKIIRNDSIGDFSWDYTSTGSSDNNWSNSTLQIMLNNAYYRSEGTTYYNNSKEPISVDFSSIGLSNIVINKVEEVIWYTGNQTPDSYSNLIYLAENDINSIWLGKIALMYQSDYGYASDFKNCKTTVTSYNNCIKYNWIYNEYNQWTFTRGAEYANRARLIHNNGAMRNYTGGTAGVYSVRPSLYLKSDITLLSGTGTDKDPYVIQ